MNLGEILKRILCKGTRVARIATSVQLQRRPRALARSRTASHPPPPPRTRTRAGTPTIPTAFRLLPSNARSDTQAPPPPGSGLLERELGSARSLAVLAVVSRRQGPAGRERPGRGCTLTGAERDLVTMAGPLALQLEQLLNPRPREADPEADPEEGEA